MSHSERAHNGEHSDKSNGDVRKAACNLVVLPASAQPTMLIPQVFTKFRDALRRHKFSFSKRSAATTSGHAPASPTPVYEQQENHDASLIPEHRGLEEPETSATNFDSLAPVSPHEGVDMRGYSDGLFAASAEGIGGIAPIDLGPLRLPNFGGASSEETLAGVTNINNSSQETVVQHPALIERIVQGCVQSHHAIKDHPPPFIRHSAPERHRNGPQKQAEIVEKERLQLQENCVLIDAERERLATRLEQVCQELADEKEHLERAVEDLAVREARCNSLQRDQGALMADKQEAIEAFDRKRFELDALKEQKIALENQYLRRIEHLNAWGGKKKRELRTKIAMLEEELIVTRGQLRRSQLALARLEENQVGIARLLQVDSDLTAATEQLDAKQRQLETLQAERIQETEDLKLAEREVYTMTQRIRTMRGTVGEQDEQLKALRQANSDLARENRCLRRRVAAAYRITL